MKKITVLLLYILSGFLLVVEGTVNVCIPLSHSPDKNIDTNKLLQEVEAEIIEKLSNNSKPIHIDHIDVDINHPAIRLYGSLDNVDIYNLQNYNICLFNNYYNESSKYFDIFNLTFTKVRIEGYYNLTGDFGDLFDIFGIGDFWLELGHMSISMTNFTINQNETDLCFPINIDTDFPEINIHFKNLMNDTELEELVEKAVHAIGPEALKIVWSELKDIFDKPIEEAINNLFHLQNVPDFLNKMFNPDLFTNVADIGALPYCFANDEDAKERSVILT